jgi:hypothetical protein
MYVDVFSRYHKIVISMLYQLFLHRIMNLMLDNQLMCILSVLLGSWEFFQFTYDQMAESSDTWQCYYKRQP